MNIPLIDLRPQYETARRDIEAAVAEVVQSQAFVLGPMVERFERAMAEYVGVRHAIGCASGTDALFLVLRALGLQLGDEVILPAFTFFATAGAVWNAGLRPIFCDVDRETFNVTADTVAACWSDRTRVIIPVHLYGQMAPMNDLMTLAHDRGAFVLEDAAQAVGARQTWGGEVESRQVMAGAAGHAAAFSFFPTKNLGGFGDGGLVTTSDDGLADRVRKLRVHGGQQMYHHEMVGVNSRLDALQAAVLHAKLPYLDAWNETRRENAILYGGLLSGLEEVTLPAQSEHGVHVFHQYTIRVRARDELRTFLGDRGIGSGVYYPVPLHFQECFASLGYRTGDLPVCEALSREVVSLPIYPELGGERIATVAGAVNEFYGAS